ncbi:uncharacterized protein LOC26536325 [Drosophila yakuba]|uniref:Uncharacterized protein, isoform A n=1 Tax=Drosophila yakuba TaxID=7245 RepID=A0A0R1E960_DROYA|nr:uncharacterized protein LOC26536325 [Drosophila yakuba]KRK05803.1 uncharacterized protein Dyak_GE29144, isoform A [Drosophila yakuba]
MSKLKPDIAVSRDTNPRIVVSCSGDSNHTGNRTTRIYFHCGGELELRPVLYSGVPTKLVANQVLPCLLNEHFTLPSSLASGQARNESGPISLLGHQGGRREGWRGPVNWQPAKAHALWRLRRPWSGASGDVGGWGGGEGSEYIVEI